MHFNNVNTKLQTLGFAVRAVEAQSNFNTQSQTLGFAVRAVESNINTQSQTLGFAVRAVEALHGKHYSEFLKLYRSADLLSSILLNRYVDWVRYLHIFI
jgi:hypothetical protein